FSANRLEDLNQWSKLTEDALKRKLKLVEQILTCSKLNSLSLFEVENLHKNYSKHFDSKKNGYLDKKALNQCLSDLGADFDDSEIDDIFDKNGVRSKKTPNLKLLSFKKFSDFFNRAGSVRSRRKILESFANLNNGVPFVTKRQLATKLSLNDLNFVENEIKMATDNNEKLFFSKWIEKVFEGEPKERTATNLENRKEKTIKKLFLKKRKSVL
ncbi:actin binding, partial [Bonamia ostreae]